MNTAGHGGNVWRLATDSGIAVDELLDFSANINPLGPPDWLRSTISSAISGIVHYPDPDCAELVHELARQHQVEQNTILPGNGSAELLAVIPRALGARRALLPVPCYIDYRTAAEAAELEVIPLEMTQDDSFRLDFLRLERLLKAGDVVLLGQPNNPTGISNDPVEIRALARRFPESTFVIDEAFVDFLDENRSLIVERPSNVLVLRSFTKILAIPGLRLGYVVADEKIILSIRRLLPPWSVNTLAQKVGLAAITSADEYQRRTRTLVSQERSRVERFLRETEGVTVFSGEANFLLVRVDRPGLDALRLAQDLLVAENLAIRVCSNYEGLDERYFRIAIRTPEENERLCAALDRLLNGSAAHFLPSLRQKTPALMLQGTSSGAGKSLLAAAFCRIFLDDGFRVAPFKSQNMSLNSFVTRDGGEMGRAQVVQALACRLPPDVRMNPILLKPSSDTGAQVIQLGHAVGQMNVEEFIRFKAQAFTSAKLAYDELAQDQDVMVLEGAGSPAEVNLAQHDIVNMAMARYAKARVLIVGDIDRGGVFAAFAGTIDALKEAERAFVAGFIVNRFRGRAELLREGLDWVQRTTGRPILGVVPYLHRLGLPEEDSVALERRELESVDKDCDTVKVGVVHLPHISNFTDFDALEAESDVTVRFLRTPEAVEDLDAVVIPGSKNVMADAHFLKESGWSGAIRQLAARDVAIVGICGGFQLLGGQVVDPYEVESKDGVVEGLGLLPLKTILEADKTLRLVEAKHIPTGLRLRGYEIHHGSTENSGGVPLIDRADGAVLGIADARGLIWGTYLHGLFDTDDFRRHFINGLRRRNGLHPLDSGHSYDIEPALQRLADAVRESIDMDWIYRDLGLR